MFVVVYWSSTIAIKKVTLMRWLKIKSYPMFPRFADGVGICDVATGVSFNLARESVLGKNSTKFSRRYITSALTTFSINSVSIFNQSNRRLRVGLQSSVPVTLNSMVVVALIEDIGWWSIYCPFCMATWVGGIENKSNSFLEHGTDLGCTEAISH
jgi:hypothetical protein